MHHTKTENVQKESGISIFKCSCPCLLACLGDGTGPLVPDSPSPSLPASDDDSDFTTEVMQDCFTGQNLLLTFRSQ